MSGNTMFHSLVGEGGGGRCRTNWPTEIVEMATLCEFDENDRLFTTFCDPYMGHTFRLVFTYFTLKRIQRMAFKKNA
jgi:hypothetical protein